MQKNDFNKIIITGYANSVPRLNSTFNGTPVLNFELRCNSRKRSEIFDITVWGDLAKTASELIFPNEKLLIEGHVQHKLFGDNKEPLGCGIELVARRIYSVGNDFNLCEFTGS